MTQFVRLTSTDGSVSRVNVASISRYYPYSQDKQATAIELAGGGMFVVGHSVSEVDDFIRNTDKGAVVSGG